MELTERQEKILSTLIKEYLDLAEPISSEFLKERAKLSVSPATIRNELQELTDKGYITQPHTSAGRIPTEKGYRFFVSITFSGDIDEFPSFIVREIESAKEKIDRELQLVQKLTKSLEEISSLLDFKRIEEDMLLDVLRIIGPSRTTYKKNIDTIGDLLKEFERF